MRNKEPTLAPVALLLTAVGALLFGCDDDESTTWWSEYLDVIALRPLDPVPVDASLIVEFSHPFLLASAESRVRLEQRDTDEVVSSTLSVVTGAPTLLRVTPSAPLAYATAYRMAVGRGIESPVAGPLEVDSPLVFHTESAPTPGMTVDFSPFRVCRHGIDLRAMIDTDYCNLRAGADGFALIHTNAAIHAYVLPTGQTQRINAAWYSGTGVTFLAYGDGPGTGGGVLRYALGERHLVAATDDAVSGVFGIDEDLVYGTCAGEILEFTGTGSRILSGPDAAMFDIWGHRGPEGIVLWVAGSEGLYRGVTEGSAFTWERMHGTSFPVIAVSGIDADSVVAVGNGSVLREGVGTEYWTEPGYTWTDVFWHPDAPGPVIVGVTPSGTGAGFVYTAATPTVLEVCTEPLYGVNCWPESTGRLASRAVGAAGMRVDVDLDLDGWTPDPLPKRDAGGEVAAWTDLASAAPGTLYAVRAGMLLTGGSDYGPVQPMDGPEGLVLTKLCCDTEGSLYVAGLDDGGIDWFVGHFDGSTWTTHWMSSMDEPRDLWAADPGNIFVVCDHGLGYRLGTLWTPMTVTTTDTDLRGVWGTAPDSVYAVGEGGTIAHYTVPEGETEGVWSLMASGTTNDLNAIGGASEDYIVAVGDNGTILRYDGDTWSDMDPSLDLEGVDLSLVCTSSADRLFAASADGVVIRYDAGTWQRWTVPVPNARLQAVAATSSATPWFGGEGDLLLQFATPPVMWFFDLIYQED